MKKFIRNKLKQILDKLFIFSFGYKNNIYFLLNKKNLLFFDFIENKIINSSLKENSKLYPPYKICNSTIGEYSYIAQNSIINNTTLGKFCSIGPNLISGWGIHPTIGISTHPMFYSTKKQNGITLSTEDKIEELKPIQIGNDVFIGMNVTILDGVAIGDGAIIGAGAVVSKNIPPYAIALGNPIKIIKYRFNENIIQELLVLKWWDLSKDELKLVEHYFWDIDTFIKKIKEIKSSKNI